MKLKKLIEFQYKSTKKIELEKISEKHKNHFANSKKNCTFAAL